MAVQVSDGIKGITRRNISRWGTGTEGAGENFIDYVTIASTGNAVDFGDHIISLVEQLVV